MLQKFLDIALSLYTIHNRTYSNRKICLKRKEERMASKFLQAYLACI